jgi:hypothetical protein
MKMMTSRMVMGERRRRTRATFLMGGWMLLPLVGVFVEEEEREQVNVVVWTWVEVRDRRVGT